ncbi:MAG: hypothetical protein Q9217_006703, partial [Psora testacea]
MVTIQALTHRALYSSYEPVPAFSVPAPELAGGTLYVRPRSLEPGSPRLLNRWVLDALRYLGT